MLRNRTLKHGHPNASGTKRIVVDILTTSRVGVRTGAADI